MNYNKEDPVLLLIKEIIAEKEILIVKYLAKKM